MGEQKPTVGRIVHYQDATETLAAVIAKVNADGSLNLGVFQPMGNVVPIQNVKQASGPIVDDRHWNWPTRT